MPSRGSFFSFPAQNVTVDEIVSAYKQACQKLNCKQIPKLLKQIQVGHPRALPLAQDFVGSAPTPPALTPQTAPGRGSLISSSFLLNLLLTPSLGAEGGAPTGSLSQRFGPGMLLKLKRARACSESGAEPGFAPGT